MRLYLDTSAAAKLIVEEPESEALARYLDEPGIERVALLLLETELRRFVARQHLDQLDATRVLAGVGLYDMPRSLYQQAGLLPGPDLRSVDALHLAGAMQLEVDVLVTYDDRLTEAAEGMGVRVERPQRR